MKWLKMVAQCFLLLSLVGMIKSIALHTSVIYLSPSSPLPKHGGLDIGIFIVWGVAACTLQVQFPLKSENWLKVVFQYCPLWMKILLFCILAYGTVVGISHWFLTIESGFSMENHDYWWLRQASAGLIVMYSIAAAIFYSALKHSKLSK